ncbi:MAG: DUF4417 domain-containing protein [Oscillospiraceae bacterium]|nr:DUF4417 domain-containing protein [Oscillospiraceae bacterium]
MRGLLNYDLALFKEDNFYDFPTLISYKEEVKCEKWVNFHASIKNPEKAEGLHFYEHDYKFERIWNNPGKYISVFKRFKYIIQPDFSLYYNFPVALQIYNKFRNHWLACYYSVYGIEMIPNISLSCETNYSWSLLGYPTESVVAFSDIGCVRHNHSRIEIRKTYDEMIRQLNPRHILYFTRSIEKAPAGAQVIKLPFIKGGE